MKLTEDLPIYRDTYELVSTVVDYVAKFPKLYRFSIGQRLLDCSLSLFEYLLLANRSYNHKETRVKWISNFLLKFENVKILIRLCSEKHIISIKQTSRLAILTSSIGRQATGWKNA